MPDFTIQQIEDFLNGKLSETELIAFNEQLASNLDFKKEVDDHRLIFEGLKGMEMDNFRNEVADWESEIAQVSNTENKNNSDSKKEAKGNKRGLLLGILLALLLAFLAYNYFNSSDLPAQKPTPELVKKRYIASGSIEKSLTQPFQNLSSADSLINETLSYLRNKNYEEAAKTIEAVSVENKDFTRLKLIKGLCFLNQNYYLNAYIQFREVKTSGQSNIHLKEEAEWLEAIALIASGTYDKEQVKQLLSNIKQNTNHKYHKDASSFLDAF